MNIKDLLQKLDEEVSVGLDMSPRNEICRLAAEKIRSMQEENMTLEKENRILLMENEKLRYQDKLNKLYKNPSY